MVHHFETLDDEPMTITEDSKIQAENSLDILSLDIKDAEKGKCDGAELNSGLIIHDKKFKIEVSSVGTLDLKGFIEMAMNLPSFNRRGG